MKFLNRRLIRRHINVVDPCLQTSILVVILISDNNLVQLRGVVVSGVRGMNKVNPRRARLVLAWVTVFGIPSRNVTNLLGQLSLASLRGRLIECQLRLG